MLSHRVRLAQAIPPPGTLDYNRVGGVPIAELIYRVAGMHCGNCEQAVKQELSQVEGVESVEVDLESKLVLVRGDDLSDEKLRTAIDEAGYEAEAA